MSLNFYIILLFFSLTLQASEICSRVATVNFQEILVDVGASAKGEGLRFYLEKDEKALELLNEYQINAKPDWKSTALSSIGGTMIIFGATRKNDTRGGLLGRDNLVLGGATIIALSYLITKTIQYNNEVNLQRAVEEYNKRNRPLIYFSPFVQDGKHSGSSALGIGIQGEF